MDVSKKVSHFFKNYSFQEYKSGELLITPESIPEGVFYLAKGVVRCYALSKKGEELTLNLYKSPSYFPMLWVMNDKPERYFYEALSNTHCYIADKIDFKDFIQKEHDVAYDLLTRIYRGMGGYFMRMESLLSGDAYFRTLASILIYGYRFSINRQDSVDIKLTHSQIASDSGLSRETVTRVIKKLQLKGLIEYKGEKIHIYSLEKLEKEVLE